MPERGFADGATLSHALIALLSLLLVNTRRGTFPFGYKSAFRGEERVDRSIEFSPINFPPVEFTFVVKKNLTIKLTLT